MCGAARKAGRSLARDFGEVAQLQVSIKGPANFVTAADHRAEEIIFNELSRARPGYGFLMEERGEVKGADATHRFIELVADYGLDEACHRQPALLGGINVKDGQVTCRAVAEAHGMPFTKAI